VHSLPEVLAVLSGIFSVFKKYVFKGIRSALPALSALFPNIVELCSCFTLSLRLSQSSILRRIETRIHARQNRETPTWGRGQLSPIAERIRIVLVSQ
jgi:hypothetical protein